MESRKSNKAVMGILVVVFLSFVMLMIFASYTMKNMRSGSESFKMRGFGENASIAVVEVNGVIMQSRPMIELIQQAEKDQQTSAIIVRINSPGGAVGPTQEIYEEIRRIDNLYNESEAKEGKPIYASFGTIAASGGYYLGAATRKIYANSGTLTGSIGVIMQFMDLSRLYEWAMVKQTNITSGQFKDIGQPNRSMSAQEKALLESTVKDVHKQFVRDIERTRKEKLKTDINEIAQGQVFSGDQAKKHGLVDEIGSLWQAGRAIHAELNLKTEFGLKFIEKKKKSGLWTLMENFDEASTNIGKITKALMGQNDQTKLLFR